MEIYYVNSKNEKISFADFPYAIQNPEAMFENGWEYDSASSSKNGGKITKFKKSIMEKTISLSIWADSKEEYNFLMNRLNEVIEIDVLNKQPGKLYVNGYYLKCYLYASKYSEYEEDFYTTDKDISLVSEYPFWIQEKEYEFFKDNMQNDTSFLDYAFDYAYDYKMNRYSKRIENTHYGDCNFSMIIFGPCINPSIKINAHEYAVMTTLYEGEYLVINSVECTIVKHDYRGYESNLFNARKKESDIFKPIPSGVNIVTWNIAFGFQVTLLIERSEPEWIFT